MFNIPGFGNLEPIQLTTSVFVDIKEPKIICIGNVNNIDNNIKCTQYKFLCANSFMPFSFMHE